MKRLAITVLLLMLIGCSGRTTSPITPGNGAPPPKGPDQQGVGPIVSPPAPGSSLPSPTPAPAKPAGEVISREQAIELANPGRAIANWDAVLVADFVPWSPDPGSPQPRSTWIVQRIQPGPNETYYVDALTGEVYRIRQTEAPAPPFVVKTMQGAVDAVFRSVGTQGDFTGFSPTIGVQEGYILVGGPIPGAKLPTTFETAATAAGGGHYEVRLTRRWRLNEQASFTTWTFSVQADGIVLPPLKTGADLPAIK